MGLGRAWRQSLVSARVRIYIEGGGNHDHNLERLFRRSWTEFFKAAKLQGHAPRIVRGGARGRTFRLFRNALTSSGPDDLPVLLVDSEAPVAPTHGVWRHLQAHDGWGRPPDAGDDQAFLMVQVMETWLLADRHALRRYFGSQFAESRIPLWPELEGVPKDAVIEALTKASSGCRKRYAKGKVSFELLAQVGPDRVVAACPHAKALLGKLRNR